MRQDEALASSKFLPIGHSGVLQFAGATEFDKVTAARVLHELARKQKAGVGVYKSSTKFGITIYYLVPVLRALVVGIESVKRTCTSLNFEEKISQKMLKMAFRRE